MSYTIPAVADFVAQFDRDFPFTALLTNAGTDDSDLNRIRTSDVAKAIAAAGINFNEGLWSDQTSFTYAYCLLAAHFLCINIKASTQGLVGRGGEWLRNAFSVGDVSAGYQLPPRMVNSTITAPLLETTYGCQYLQILAPMLVGAAYAVCGHTKP